MRRIHYAAAKRSSGTLRPVLAFDSILPRETAEGSASGLVFVPLWYEPPSREVSACYIGVGKGTIIAKFMELAPEGSNSNNSRIPRFCFSVSHTTRSPRPGEVDGVHYHFVAREYMKEKIDAGDFFLEHAEVHGNLYGTSFRAIFDVSNNDEPASGSGGSDGAGGGSERQCLLDIDVEGVRSIKEYQARQRREKELSSGGPTPSPAQRHPSNAERAAALPEIDAKFIFIAPPSADVLRERLAGRGTETPETLERRFRNAEAELEYGMGEGNFDAVVVNDDLDAACAEFQRAVEEMYAGRCSGEV